MFRPFECSLFHQLLPFGSVCFTNFPPIWNFCTQRAVEVAQRLDRCWSGPSLLVQVFSFCCMFKHQLFTLRFDHVAMQLIRRLLLICCYWLDGGGWQLPVLVWCLVCPFPLSHVASTFVSPLVSNKSNLPYVVSTYQSSMYLSSMYLLIIYVPI